MMPLFAQQQTRIDTINRVLREQISGLRVIRAFTAEPRETDRFAVANAEHNNHLRGDNLVVKAAYVDEGPTLKRIRPRAKGSASRINKRTCHITIVVAPREEA